MFNISPSYLPTFGDDLVEGLGIGCKNGDYPCPQLPEEDWAQKRKRGAGSFAKGGGGKNYSRTCSGILAGGVPLNWAGRVPLSSSFIFKSLF